MRRLLPLALLLTAALLPVIAIMHSAEIQAQADQRCFTETGFCITGRIRAFWEQNGGLSVFGFPITPQQSEAIEGQTRQVQWFQRNRLELHPDQAPPYDVLLGRLGADTLEQQGRNWYAFPTSEAQAGCRFFAETRHNVCGAILTRWRANGLELDGISGTSEAESLALFGLPLSDALVETLSDGRQYTVQWFERARFELHPEQPSPDNVLLGLLGLEMRTSSQEIVADTPAPTPPPVRDTRKIAFVSDRSGNNEIYVMNADGTGLRNLTNHSADDTQPAWSPDGKQIAFVSDREGNPEVYVMTADGAGLFKRLTRLGANNRQPVWSPDGRYIAFASEIRGATNIYSINTFGSGLISLTNSHGISESPTWTRDGTRIAFATNRENGNWEIFTMLTDGTEQMNISSFQEDDRDPDWSPDGTRIAFASNRDGAWNIFVMNADGTRQTNLTNATDDAGFPAWSPDGQQIAFHSLRFVAGQPPDYEIYVMNAADGTGLRNLTNDPAEDIQPAWSPVQ